MTSTVSFALVLLQAVSHETVTLSVMFDVIMCLVQDADSEVLARDQADLHHILASPSCCVYSALPRLACR